MSSDYFDSSTVQITQGTTARSTDINAISDAVDTGLALLPTEAQIKRGTINYVAGAGTANAHTVLLPHAPTGYSVGMEVVFKPTASNTAAATIDVNSLGEKTIARPDGSALQANDLIANDVVILRYNGTEFHLLGFPNAGAAASTAAAASATAAAASAVAAAASAADGALYATAVYTEITANTTAEAGKGYAVTANSVELTLPNSPTDKDKIHWVDAGAVFSTNTFTIKQAASAETIMGVAADMTIKIKNHFGGIVLIGTDWRLFR